MAKSRSGVIAALDIGSSKTACFVAHAAAEGGIRVIGVGHHASEGVRAGAIVSMDSAERSILAAIAGAEQISGERLRSVVINMSGGSPASRVFDVEVPVVGQEVSDSDVKRVHGGTGADDGAGNGRQLIHSIPVGYTLDGSRGIRDPRGMFGERLGVNVHQITAASGAYRNLTTCVRRCHLDVEQAVVTPYASGLACLVEDEIDLGVTVVDMGGGTTTIAIFYDGSVMHTDTVRVGGNHVTGDIARGLTTPLREAERMKILYGSAISQPSDGQELIDVPLIGEEDDRAEPNHVPRSMLVGIIRPRLEEIFELVRDRVQASGLASLAGRRVVLTGGASQLPGTREMATLILEKQTRMGRPLRFTGLPEATSGPAFSACAGLLRFVLAQRDKGAGGMAHAARGERLGRLGQWFKENF